MWLKRTLLITFLLLTSQYVAANQSQNASQPDTQHKAKRIVALAPHIVENLFAIGAGDKIVGTVEYADYPEQALEISRIGGYHGIQLEKLLALKPDLVIAWQTGNKKADLEKLEQLGIKVVYSETNDLTKVSEQLTEFGELTGHQVQAKQVAKEFDVRLAKLQSQYQDAKSLDVFYQLWPEPMMSVNKNTMIHQVLSICQVNNVFAHSRADYPQISIENVLKFKPQVIVLPEEKTKKDVQHTNWQNWPQIPAVEHQQFIRVNADLLHRFSVRALDGVADLCDKLSQSRRYYQEQS
ncbi:cobalamin-binding protein [Pseudoalteromonas phenolica]|uniref:Cobalamin-binding protein n=1 Tax=Pseudoalteromonas phenolica TaxID=161398 RepID=A0A5R9Q4N5_9GAMM|nr:cobalamin-binding protein [Pseudoalteromonas phenolica]TLX47592.1 cobalamin-binding protein [Pseudoalteromonas phenolica]